MYRVSYCIDIRKKKRRMCVYKKDINRIEMFISIRNADADLKIKRIRYTMGRVCNNVLYDFFFYIN